MPNIFNKLKKDKERSALLLSNIEEELPSYKVAIEKNPKTNNAKKLSLKVKDSGERTFTIERKLTDFHWLRDKLRMDFPFSYVTIYLKKINFKRYLQPNQQVMLTTLLRISLHIWLTCPTSTHQDQ